MFANVPANAKLSCLFFVVGKLSLVSALLCGWKHPAVNLTFFAICGVALFAAVVFCLSEFKRQRQEEREDLDHLRRMRDAGVLPQYLTDLGIEVSAYRGESSDAEDQLTHWNNLRRVSAENGGVRG